MTQALSTLLLQLVNRQFLPNSHFLTQATQAHQSMVWDLLVLQLFTELQLVLFPQGRQFFCLNHLYIGGSDGATANFYAMSG